MILITILLTTLIISLITDVRKRKILNIVTLPTILVAFLYYSITLGWSGFLYSGKGFLVGLGLLLIPYLLGGMGAGDVKLMAAIGALMGPSFVFYSFIYTALIGGAIALILIIKKHGFINITKSIFFNVVFFRSSLGSMTISKDQNSSISFPYGVAIVLGTLCTLIWGGF
ncbi:A24 family peptidase [Neobacillus massiliamazoniensis]|uniref:Type IV leader peptidase family protein n=1 Tax=Neobacillus massiliamazoniensis TaxID=1499688 RepID=A0A0U1NU23_9BACI|nr:prepilin peptidase [Neobacillus massiliamazoniensis]CRK81534.1 Type IV leader peptidase family protein [Neobacillus massiliamazoniensis]